MAFDLRIRNFSLIIIIILLLGNLSVIIPTPGQANQTFAGPFYVSGLIDTSVTWTKDNSPYIITDNLTIGTNGILNIFPGVQVKVDKGEWLKVLGKIYCNGSSVDGIIEFTGNGTSIPGWWDAIYIMSDGNIINHTTIHYGNTSVILNGTITTPVKNNYIENCTIADTFISGIDLIYADNNIIKNNSFDNCWKNLGIQYSNSNTILMNNNTWASTHALSMLSSNSNKFYDNTYFDNSGNTYQLDNCNNNEFYFEYIVTKQTANYGFYINGSSSHNTFYNINISDSWGIFTTIENSNNITFNNMSYYAPPYGGPQFSNATDINIIKSTIDTSTSSLQLSANSHVTVIDTIFDNDTVNLGESLSEITVGHSLNVRVIDSQSLLPIQGANVAIKNKTGSTIGNFVTDTTGWIGEINAITYIGQDKNVDTDDLDAGERKYHTPHNVSITNQYYYSKYAVPQPNMNQSRDITVPITQIPIDYIVIQDQPGAGGANISGNYGLGTIKTFYASGYNTPLGYIREVTADWASNDSTIATVTTPGTQTTFTADSKNSGPVRITAQFGAVNTYADLIITDAAADYIVIKKDPIDIAPWVGNVEYNVGMNDTFYCVGYNNSAGFIGTVTAMWQLLDDSLGTVEPVGTSTRFTASNTNTGSTIIRATYNLLENETGITVKPPEIDRIEIQTASRTWAGDKIYTVDDTENLLCAGYNTSKNVYIADVNATWSTLDPEYGTVTSPGKTATFRAVSKGETQVMALYSGLVNYTGKLRIEPAFGNFDLTCSIKTTPQSPLIEDSSINITVTVENLGPDAAENVIVHFLVQYPGDTVYTLESNDSIQSLASLGKTEFNYPKSSVPRGTYNLTAIVDPIFALPERDETNNRADHVVRAISLADYIVTIEIDPSNITITSDESVQFNATGIGLDDSRFPISPAWSANGGGDMFSSGMFIATKVGVWEIYADLGTVRGIAHVTITPGIIKALVITEKQIAFELNENFQFGVKGYDSDGNEVQLPPGIEWYVNGTIGIIDKNTGLFNATDAGVGRISAQIFTEGQWFIDEINVVVKLFIIIEKEYTITTESAKLNITVAFAEEGAATVKELTFESLGDVNITTESFGDEYVHIDVFVQIEIPSGLEWDWIIIEIEYDPSKLPADINENDLVIFYFDEVQKKWVKIENSWVVPAENKIYANVTHLTIFAPMAESSGAADGPGDEDGPDEPPLGMSMIVILGLVAVVFIIAIAAGVIIVRRRKPPEEAKEEKKKEEGEEGREEELKEKEMVEDRGIAWDEEDEDIPIDLSVLTIVTKKCPKCKTEINVEPTFDDKAHLECPECGKKGKLPNPYLDEIARLKESKKAKPKHKEEEIELIEIECRKCGEPIEVKYTEDPKVKVKCDECGAKGAIKNPYLKVERGKEERRRERPKPPKDRKPPKPGDEDEVDFDFTKEEEEIEEEDLISADDEEEEFDFDFTKK
jgi:parallel beta-helix repeat protein